MIVNPEQRADALARLALTISRGSRPYAVDLGAGPEPGTVIARLDSGTPVAALWGEWFGGGALLLLNPLCWLGFEHAEDAFEQLDQQPNVSDVAQGVLGGGWLACLGYSAGTTWLGFFDHLLRWRSDTGWTFETLGLPGREREIERALDDARTMITEDESVLALRQAQGADRRAQGANLIDPSTGSGHEPELSLRLGEFDTAPGAQEVHLRGVESAIARIERGDFYQLNLCTRLRASFAGRPAEVFAAAATRLQPRYGAMIDTGSGRSVISFSPELFLALHGTRVRTSPIKGTSSTSIDADGSALVGSRKDVAENIMITDLMRNDLSRVCRPGTVEVSDLLELQPHPGVWHLVSTVGGDLRPGTPRAELLRATFPPGSVTGAPKISAQAGIASLEPQTRGAYTGALGFLTPTAGAELSVIIRTFEISGETVELGVGGGITVDSVPIREWNECLHKAEPLVRAVGGEAAAHLRAPPAAVPDELLRGGLIETLLARSGTVLRLAAHLARLDRSCRELYGRSLTDDLGPVLQQTAREHGGDRTGLRIRVLPTGGRLDVTVESWSATAPPDRLRLVHATRPDQSWRHKWGDRTAYMAAESVITSRPGSTRTGATDVLPYFTTPAGNLAETSRGNLCCRGVDHVWRTPPEDENVLPGITRRDLLHAWTDLGQSFEIGHVGPAALRSANAIVSTSSISGVLIIDRIDDHRFVVSEDLEVHVADLNRRLGFG